MIAGLTFIFLASLAEGVKVLVDCQASKIGNNSVNVETYNVTIDYGILDSCLGSNYSDILEFYNSSESQHVMVLIDNSTTIETVINCFEEQDADLFAIYFDEPAALPADASPMPAPSSWLGHINRRHLGLLVTPYIAETSSYKSEQAGSNTQCTLSAVAVRAV